MALEKPLSQPKVKSIEKEIRILSQRNPKRLNEIQRGTLERLRETLSEHQILLAKQTVEKTVPSVEHQPPEAEIGEKEMSELIEKIENGFLAFANMARPKIQEHVTEEWLRQELDVPFQLLEKNRNSPYRNFVTMCKHLNSEQPIDPSQIPPNQTATQHLRLPDYQYFCFRLHEHMPYSNTYAAYSPTARTIHLPTNLDPGNLFQMSILFHELVHVGQDLATRSRMRDLKEMNRYYGFHMTKENDTPRTFVDDEYIAHALQLELLNAFLRGKLRTRSVSSKMLMQELRAGEDEFSKKEVEHFLPKILQAFYPEGLKAGQRPPDQFCKFIRAFACSGHQLFSHAADDKGTHPIIPDTCTSFTQHAGFPAQDVIHFGTSSPTP